MQSRFNCSSRHTQRFSDLFVAQTLDLPKENHLSMVRRKRLKHLGQIQPSVGARLPGGADGNSRLLHPRGIQRDIQRLATPGAAEHSCSPH